MNITSDIYPKHDEFFIIVQYNSTIFNS